MQNEGSGTFLDRGLWVATHKAMCCQTLIASRDRWSFNTRRLGRTDACYPRVFLDAACNPGVGRAPSVAAVHAGRTCLLFYTFPVFHTPASCIYCQLLSLGETLDETILSLGLCKG